MIVCHCFTINDARIRALIDDDDTVRDVMFKCGAGRDCGGCLAAVKALVAQHHRGPVAVAVAVPVAVPAASASP